MFTSLNPGAIGVKADLGRAAELAARYGFAELHVNIEEVADLGVERARDILSSAGVRPAAFGLPVDYRVVEPQFADALERLPRLCQAAAGLGITRTSTWVPSWHDELDSTANRAFHTERFVRIAKVLAPYDIRLGLEFLGPKTLRDGHRYDFIHTMPDMLALCADIGAQTGTHNLGLLLDAFHWYTAGGKLADLYGLKDADIVDVHVNDAQAGLPPDEQIDQVRTLPGETGVIGVPAFLHALNEIGYSGPVMVEPFSARVRAMPPEEAVKATGEALQSVWHAAGL
jgi:sugar phosphate isomerase/epimerase